jgi:hypothetical protein
MKCNAINQEEAIDHLLTTALLGEPAAWPAIYGDGDAERLLAHSAEHGVQPLLFHQLRNTASVPGWPAQIVEALKSETARQSILNDALERELRQVLAALARAGVFPLLMKGTPLSYSHYPFPYLRPHSDTDMLIRKSDRAATRHILGQLGYVVAANTGGELVSHQITYAKYLGPGICSQLDIHWKVANPQLFAEKWSFAELERSSVSLPALGDHARALDNVHALLLACMHRVAHHYDSDYLIWIYDIHLLASSLNRAEFEAFAQLAADAQLRAICLRGLELAHRCFGTALPQDVIEAQLAHVGDAPEEATARFAQPDLRRLDLLRSDLASLDRRRRLQLLKELLFPSGEYMLQRYNLSIRALLPALYLHRAASGVVKFLRRISH